ncbi:MAG: PASTA domain-containing protein [Candidatus Cloacimonetes bacterium]|nr:PASTA domain-containing protein [Candidatus Cloacimonadota bacterium]
MQRRFNIFLFFNGVIVFVWICYLFTVQLLDPFNLKEIISLRQNPAKNIIIPQRGNILDRNGELLISSQKLFQLDVDRNAIAQYCLRSREKKVTEIYTDIAEVIANSSDLEKKYVLKRLNNQHLPASIFITDNITEAELAEIKIEIKNRNLPGIIINFSKIRRYYPHDRLAASLLGMTKETSNNLPGNNSIFEIHGVCGLEATFDSELCGTYGWQETIYDAKNERIPLLFLKEKPAENGNSLYLTLDANLQAILEQSLASGLRDYSAKKAIGVIMDPHTGEILAMSGLSKGYSNLQASELRAMGNLPATFMFEPGSTLKPFTALLALEQEIYKADDKIDCRDYRLEYGRESRLIKDAHEFRYLSFRDIIAYSSNVGISKIVEEVGSRTLYERMIELGFGHKTGSRLAGEATGILRNLNDWQGFSLHSISFGQEIAVTALQLANSYCVLANGGQVFQPNIIKEIQKDNGKVLQNSNPVLLRKISDKVSLDTLKVFLKSVVDYGSAVATKMEYVDIAGKTGTAEKIIGGENSYSKDKFTSIFAGFFPVENPSYVIVVIFDEPSYEFHYASTSAVPTFRQIVTRIINQPNCDMLVEMKEKEGDFIKMPDLIGKTKKDLISILQRKKISYSLQENDPEGSVINQYPQPGVIFDRKETVVVILDSEKQPPPQTDSDFRMPNLIGLTVKQALAETIRHNIRLQISGNGIISYQSINPGDKTDFGEICAVKAR